MREKISLPKLLPLGFQHVFAMFGATIFVPLATGLDLALALFTSGIGTLLYFFISFTNNRSWTKSSRFYGS